MYEYKVEQLKEAIRREGGDPQAVDWHGFDRYAPEWNGTDFNSRNDIERALQDGGVSPSDAML